MSKQEKDNGVAEEEIDVEGGREQEEEVVIMDREGLESEDFSEDPGEKLYFLDHSHGHEDTQKAKENSGKCPQINKDYIAPKGFFLFFYAANGTLMPYLILFFKQLRLTAGQVGVISGMKPYIAFLFIPIWGYIADKTRKSRFVYVLAMLAYSGGYFVYSLAPARHVCTFRSNSTKHTVMSLGHGHHKRSTTASDSVSNAFYIWKWPVNLTVTENGLGRRDDMPWILDITTSKGDPLRETNFQEKDDVHVDLRSIFIFLLSVTILKTIFSCPALTIVDSVTVRMLKERGETHKYGRQRLWGAIGWGVTSFGVGAILSTIPLCPGQNNEVNYYPAFYVFTALMLAALLIGLRLNFNDNLTGEKKSPMHVKEGLQLLKNPKYLYFMITAFYVGVAMAVIRTFLFWHLKDIGGTQLLFSIVSGVNCSSEVLMYFFSAAFIKKVGHIQVLYIGLFCYAVRLFYYALLPNPWYVIPVEPLSGITTAAVWASMASYVGLNSSPGSSTTLQGESICIIIMPVNGA